MNTPTRNPQAVETIHLGGAEIEVASEAIAIIDIVQATATSDLFGWYAVGRSLVRELRQLIQDIGANYGLSCIKSTGDGVLVTYRHEGSAEVAAVHAVHASFELLKRITARNINAPEERRIAIRIALHFGEVDILPNDREGPNVSYAFRIEAISRGSLPQAVNPIDPARFPLWNYLICSERISDIVIRRKPDWPLTPCGLFKLKGFSGWWELFLVSEDNGI